MAHQIANHFLIGKFLTLLKDLLGEAKKNVLSIFILLILSIVFFAMTSRKFPSFYDNIRIKDYISSKLSESYSVKIHELNLLSFGESSLLIIANDKYYQEQSNIPDNPEKMENFTPPVPKESIIILYEKTTNPLSRLNLFHIPYKKVFEFKPEVLSNIDYRDPLWIYDYKIIDLDNDGNKEIIIDLLSPIYGSGASRYFLVFGYKSSGEFDLLTSLPNVAFSPKCIINKLECADYGYPEGSIEISDEEFLQSVETFHTKTLMTNLFTKKDYIIYASHTDNFTDFLDIDKDGETELIIGHYSDTNIDYIKEFHWCPHTWLIGVYKFESGEFYIDNKWNYGRFFVTEEKISLAGALGLLETPENVTGLIQQYCLPESLHSPFYTLTRGKSELLSIVKAKYGK